MRLSLGLFWLVARLPVQLLFAWHAVAGTREH
jgi:hypothetical protein